MAAPTYTAPRNPGRDPIPAPGRRDLLGAAAGALALAVTAAAVAAPETLRASHRDAALLAMIAEANAIGAEGDRLFDLADDRGWNSPEWTAALAHSAEWMPRWHELVDQISVTPARTMEGLRAKTEIARSLIYVDTDGRPDSDERLAWSVCNDVLAMARA